MTRTDRVAAAVPLLALAYFLLQAASRIALSPALGLDEAEQVVLGRHLLWGYGPQPPLYTWLQWAFFQVLGVGVPAVALLKHLLLAAVPAAGYALARAAGGTRSTAGLAAASLLLVPQLVWESQRSLTHSILAILLALITLRLLVRILQAPTAARWAWLGAALAAGVLSKTNYLILAAAAFAALLIDPTTRRMLADRRALLAPMVAAALLAAPALWMVDHSDRVLAKTYALELAPQRPPLVNVVEGLGQLALGALAFLALALAAWAPALRRDSAGADPVRRFLERTAVLGLLLVALLVVAFQVTEVKDRWLHPVLIHVPVVLALRLGEAATPRRRRAVLAGAAAAALLVAAILPLRTLAGPRRGDATLLNLPLPRLAAAARHELPPRPLVLAPDLIVAGDLLVGLPGAAARTPEYPWLPAPPGSAPVLAWTGSGPPPPELTALAAGAGAAGRRWRELSLTGRLLYGREPVTLRLRRPAASAPP